MHGLCMRIFFFTNLCVETFYFSLGVFVVLMLSSYTMCFPKACHIGNIISTDSLHDDITLSMHACA